MSEGRIDDWRLTRSGYQITTIDGVVYKTLFDFADPKLKGFNVGSRVEFTAKPPGDGEPYNDLPYARIERVIK